LDSPALQSFTSVLNSRIERTRRTREGPAPAWYPSNLGGCERKGVLRRAGVKGTPFDIRTLRKFWMGDEVHAALQRAVEDELTAQKTEGLRFLGHELRVRTDGEFPVSGRLDTLAELGGVIEAWEYKSAASGSFIYGDFPKPEHRLQLGVYLTFPCEWTDGHGQVQSILPDRGRLIYWSKDDALMEEYIIEATPALRANVRETFRRLERLYQAYLANPENLPPVLELVQATRPKTHEPFIYLVGPKKGQPKMDFDYRCISKNNRNPCEYFGNACPVASWPSKVTTGPTEGQEEA
jgi:hypothetical protein